MVLPIILWEQDSYQLPELERINNSFSTVMIVKIYTKELFVLFLILDIFSTRIK